MDWFDATGATEWTTEDEAKLSAPALVTTIGVILDRDARRIVVASTLGHGADRAVGDVTTIPATWVKSVRLLGEVLIAETEPPKV